MKELKAVLGDVIWEMCVSPKRYFVDLDNLERRVRDWAKSKVPDRQEHIAIIKTPTLPEIVEGKFTECRTVNDWRKKGHNDCREITLKNLEE